jgi:hypothetical protein
MAEIFVDRCTKKMEVYPFNKKNGGTVVLLSF